MSLKALLNRFYHMPTAAPQDTQDREDASARNIVRRFSQGNVYLQQGRYLTEDEIDGLKTELASYDFMPRE